MGSQTYSSTHISSALDCMTGAKRDLLAQHLRPGFQQLLIDEGIPESPALLSKLETLYLPLAAWANQQYNGTPVVIGINGAQGSGKSTLAKILMHLLDNGFQRRVVTLSIDDLYLSRSEREQLAIAVHPLLQTRGVPGTHDTELGIDIISALKARVDKPVLIPFFDKAIDDRAPVSSWQTVTGPVDIILFEGWCVGSLPGSEESLLQPANDLERNQDSDGRWRHYVNERLATDYPRLFKLIDKLIMLEIPGFDKIIEWRTLQEQKLHLAHPQADHSMMTNEQVRKFIMHFERITRDNLERLPCLADITMKLNDDHQVYKVEQHRNNK